MSVRAAIDALSVNDRDVVVIEASGPVAEIVSRIRTTTEQFALVIIGPDLSPVDRAMILASIGLLAVELGPDRRIGALDIGKNVRTADILEIARFLSGAKSATGQVLTVSA